MDPRARRPGAGDGYALSRCQTLQLLQRLGADRAEYDHGRIRAPRRVLEAVDRRVGAQVVDPPATLPQPQAEGDQAELMPLALGAGEKRARAKTLNGKNVRFRVRDLKVYVNRARVTTADVGASNGVIHVINRVLLPGNPCGLPPRREARQGRRPG